MMLKTAVVGMGRWGRVLVESVQRKNDAGLRFVAGSTGTPSKAVDWAAEQGIRLHPSYEAVLADPEVQAVALATPHKQHAAQVIAAAAGKSWDDVIRERIFQPLGMTSSSTSVKALAPLPNVARPHNLDAAQTRPTPIARATAT